MEKLLWYFYKLKSYVRTFLQNNIIKHPMNQRHWCGRKILSSEEANQVIYDAISENIPFLACRHTSSENLLELCSNRERLGIRHVSMDKVRKVLCINAGMFSTDPDSMDKFAKLQLQATKNADLYACSLGADEACYIKRYLPDAQITRFGYLEPYYSKGIIWTKALEGKRVLVVHPFADSIEKQYRNKDKIWGERSILPNFNLQVVKAVQTSGGGRDERFQTWFDALEYMDKEIKQKDFDVAILGCGAYAVPLASRIKTSGKQAIVLGGATQILFGIKGKRWEEREFFRSMMNEYWIRPDDNERPENADAVEGGCYW